jgi:hypothetical protein
MTFIIRNEREPTRRLVAHLAWMVPAPSRDDTILTLRLAKVFLSPNIAIATVINGATITFSSSPEAALRIQQPGGADELAKGTQMNILKKEGLRASEQP